MLIVVGAPSTARSPLMLGCRKAAIRPVCLPWWLPSPCGVLYRVVTCVASYGPGVMFALISWLLRVNPPPVFFRYLLASLRSPFPDARPAYIKKKKNFRSCTIRCSCLSCLGLVRRSSPFCSKNGISLVELSRSKIVLRDFKMIPWELCLKYKKTKKRKSSYSARLKSLLWVPK